MFKKRAAPKLDPNQQEIDAWHDWFVEAHTARLRHTGLDTDSAARELAVIVSQAAAIHAKMREEYHARSEQR